VRLKPDELTYWLEWLHIDESWEEAWADTYDWAISNWQLDICWRLLREARRLAYSPMQKALVRYREGLFYTQTGEWQRAADCYEAALRDAPSDDFELQLSLLGEWACCPAYVVNIKKQWPTIGASMNWRKQWPMSGLRRKR